MHPSFLLAELHAESSLPHLALSALPCAPVEPHASRRRETFRGLTWRTARSKTASPLLRLRRAVAS